MTEVNNYIQRFNSMSGTLVTKVKLQSFLAKVKACDHKGLKPVEDKLNSAIAQMNGHPVRLKFSPVPMMAAEKKKAKPPVSKPKNESKSKPVVSTVASKGLFTNIDNVKPKQTFKLQGSIGDFLGDLEKFQLAITVEGDQGSGKTQFVFQVADAFAEVGYEVGIFELEIGVHSNIVIKFRNKYIAAKNRKRVQIAGEAPKGIDTVREYARKMDVIIIDSWTKLDVDSSEFDNLRKDFPDTIWIILFQRTTANKIRGGTKPLYDAGINLEVIKIDDTFVNNYAVATKNRYGSTGEKFNISSRKVVVEKKIEPAEDTKK